MPSLGFAPPPADRASPARGCTAGVIGWRCEATTGPWVEILQNWMRRHVFGVAEESLTSPVEGWRCGRWEGQLHGRLRQESLVEKGSRGRL